MNPYFIILLIVVWLGSLLGVGRWQNEAGIDEQKVVDQKEFDDINGKLTKQKADAAELLKAENAKVVALMSERAEILSNLEIAREEARKATDDARRKYSAIGLHFTAPKGTGCGVSGVGAQSAPANPASADAPASVDLPAEITADLRQLEFEADTLADEYRKCYGYAQQVR